MYLENGGCARKHFFCNFFIWFFEGESSNEIQTFNGNEKISKIN
jgi:hypothetical protein